MTTAHLLVLDRRLWTGGALLLLIAATAWIAGIQPAPDRGGEAESHVPDYFLHDFRVEEKDAFGRPLRRLRAAEMNHYADDATTELVAPWVTVYDQTRPPWDVRAETGWLSADGELLLLKGEVRLDRAAAPDVRPIHLETADVRIQPKENYAETDRHVRMESQANWAEGDGMQVWFRPLRLKLLANVRGEYVR